MDAKGVVSDLTVWKKERKLKKGTAPAAPNGAAPPDFLPFGRPLAGILLVLVDEERRGA